MPSFSKRSIDNLATCDERLRRVAHEAIKTFDFTVIEGHRGKAAQERAYAEKKSKVRWPNSKHNKSPSLAFDAVPVPLDWNDKASFHAMAKAMQSAADRVKVPIRWGGNFTGFFDGPHFELA